MHQGATINKIQSSSVDFKTFTALLSLSIYIYTAKKNHHCIKNKTVSILITTEMLLEWIFRCRFINTERFLDKTGGCYNLKHRISS